MSWYNHLTARQLQQYAGDISQLAGARCSTLNDGPGFNSRVCEVNTAAGLNFTVLPDRGMDILSCRFKGIPIAPISKVGIVNPESVQDQGYQFFNNFYCGLLTTCGLNHIGPPTEQHGLHGPFSNLRADHFAIEEFWQDDDYIILLKGTIKQAVFFKENIHLQRTIKTSLKSSSLTITDTITNRAFNTENIRLLYHINFGFPLLSPDSEIILPEIDSIPRDKEAERGFAHFNKVQAPQANFHEQVYLHRPKADKTCRFYLKNQSLGIMATCQYNCEQLPYLTQWNQFGQNEYALGLEPGLDWPLEGSIKGIQLAPLTSFSTSITLILSEIS